MRVYVVCWGSASADDRGAVSTFTNVHGVYQFLEDAKTGLVECKNEFINEIVKDHDAAACQVYGSVNDDYFEIDYPSGDTVSEIHIELVIKELN